MVRNQPQKNWSLGFFKPWLGFLKTMVGFFSTMVPVSVLSHPKALSLSLCLLAPCPIFCRSSFGCPVAVVFACKMCMWWWWWWWWCSTTTTTTTHTYLRWRINGRGKANYALEQHPLVEVEQQPIITTTYHPRLGALFGGMGLLL
jgi:hypothetical protein